MDLDTFRSMTEAEKVNFKKSHMERLKQRKQTPRVAKPSATRSKRSNINKPPKGLMKDTTTSAYGDAGAGRPVPKFLNDRKRKKIELYKQRKENMFSKGGLCKGAGAAIKGTKFKGVF
tara:strand:+ start:151 stop:504 length:354 start_codon:yes stop_codon:yes gene_type:complete